MRSIALTTAIGAVATLSGKTDALITLSVLGALGVYTVSMASVIKLRSAEPALERPFRAPLHPWLPGVAIVLSGVSFVSVSASAPAVVAVYAGVMLVGAVVFRARMRARELKT